MVHITHTTTKWLYCMEWPQFSIRLCLIGDSLEFLFIGLKSNLPKYTTLYLIPGIPPTVLEILALSLTNTLLSLTELHKISQQNLLVSHSLTSL